MRNWHIGQEVVCIANFADLSHSSCVGIGELPIKDKVYKIEGFEESLHERDAIFLVLEGVTATCSACNAPTGWHERCFKPVEKSLPKVLIDLLAPVPKVKAKETELV